MSRATVQVLYFAAARDAAGSASERVELTPGLTAGALLAALVGKYARLKKLERQLRLAVNEEFVEPDHALAADDVVALIPPVAGG